MKNTFTSIKKLSGYILCLSLLLFGKAWCATNHNIFYAEYETMKMNMALRVYNISTNASENDIAHAIKTDFASSFVPGIYTYREDLVSEYIKDIPTLITLRDELEEIFKSKAPSGRPSRFEIKKYVLAVSNPGLTHETPSTPTIYIYKDDGVSNLSASILENAIFSASGITYLTKRISAAQTIEGLWIQNAAAYLIPGGADLAYCTKLNGAGNAQIRSYVEAGGTYVGFCAGAYYGSKTVEFNRNSVSGDEVYAERELSFFPGSAVGPVLAPYEANSKTGARIAKIKWIVNGESSAQIHQVYYNGGCYFSGAASHPNVQVLGYYANEGFEGLAAIIKCKIGNGKALLSGVHPEYSAQNIQEHVLNSLSQVDRNHFEINIMPRLCDGTHRDVFRHIIEQLS